MLLSAHFTGFPAWGQDQPGIVLEPGYDPPIAAIRVEIRDPLPKGDPEQLRQLAEDLIDMAPGERLSVKRLDAAIRALKECREFQDIHIDTIPEENAVVLVFSLRPFRHIKSVEITGEFPLFEREVRRQIDLEPGDVFVEKKLKEQALRIEALFVKEGFIRPEAEVTVDTDPTDGHIFLFVAIDKGPYYQIGDLRIEGNRSLSTVALKLQMRTWFNRFLPGTAGRFRETLLRDDVKRLVEHYREKGFAEVQVEPVTELDEQAFEAMVAIRVNEGPRYRLRFEGNRNLSRRRLRKEVVLFRSGNRNDAGIRKSVRNLEKLYRQNGFLQAEVTSASRRFSDGDAGPVREVTFAVDEGPKSVVEAVSIRGNEYLSAKALREQLLTRPPGWLHDGAFMPDTLREDVRSLKTLYLKNGFMGPEVNTEVTDAPLEAEKARAEDPSQKPVAVAVLVDEGRQTRVESIVFSGTTVLAEGELKAGLQMKVGDPFREYLLRSEENLLSARISEQGYPHVTVDSAVTFTTDRTGADIVYTLRPGPLVRLGEVVFSGNFRTDEAVLRRIIRQRAGEPFSLQTMYEDQRRIRELDIVDRARLRIVGLKEKEDTVHAFFEIEEKKPFYFQTGFGYETEQGAYGKIKGGDLNFMGANRGLWFLGNSSEIGYRAEAGIGEPYLLGAPVDADVTVFAERREEFNQTFGTKSYGGLLRFSHELSDNLRAGMGFRIERREQFFTDAATPDDTLEYEPRTLLAVSPSVRFDTRDSFIRPTRGMLSFLTVDISNGLENDLDDFFRYHFDVRFYRGVSERLTLAFMSQFGYIDPYNGQDRVPDDQLFFIGGTSTVRGFDENLLLFDENGDPVGGQWALTGTVEARVALSDTLELALFADTGRLGDVDPEQGAGEFRSSVGAGIRYQTPIGPMGLLYGYKLDRKPGESAGRVHFSIGYTF